MKITAQNVLNGVNINEDCIDKNDVKTTEKVLIDLINHITLLNVNEDEVKNIFKYIYFIDRKYATVFL